jgi:hypothetical protein
MSAVEVVPQASLKASPLVRVDLAVDVVAFDLGERRLSLCGLAFRRRLPFSRASE